MNEHTIPSNFAIELIVIISMIDSSIILSIYYSVQIWTTAVDNQNHRFHQIAYYCCMTLPLSSKRGTLWYAFESNIIFDIIGRLKVPRSP